MVANRFFSNMGILLLNKEGLIEHLDHSTQLLDFKARPTNKKAGL